MLAVCAVPAASDANFLAENPTPTAQPAQSDAKRNERVARHGTMKCGLLPALYTVFYASSSVAWGCIRVFTEQFRGVSFSVLPPLSRRPRFLRLAKRSGSAEDNSISSTRR
jgi:hypothetical protein